MDKKENSMNQKKAIILILVVLVLAALVAGYAKFKEGQQATSIKSQALHLLPDQYGVKGQEVKAGKTNMKDIPSLSKADKEKAKKIDMIEGEKGEASAELLKEFKQNSKPTSPSVNRLLNPNDYNSGSNNPNLLINYKATAVQPKGSHQGSTYGRPPDTQGAVGPDHIVMAVNAELTIFTKSTGVELNTVSLLSVFSSVNSTAFPTDPRLLYDQNSGRFILIVSTFSSSSQSGPGCPCNLLLGVSASSDPTGSWYTYAIPTPGFIDYPGLGVTGDKIAITGTGGATPQINSTAWIINKSQAISGASFTPTTFTYTGHYGNGPVAPSNNVDGSDDLYLAYININDSITPDPNDPWTQISCQDGHIICVDFGKVDGDINNLVMHDLGRMLALNNNVEIGYLPQLGSLADLRSFEFAKLNSIVKTGNSLWMTSSVGTLIPPKHSGIWFGELNLSPTLSWHQQGLLKSDTEYYAFPSIAVNNEGVMALGFNCFSPTRYPSACQTIRFKDDPLGTTAPIVTGKEGEGYYDIAGPVVRWGDYSATAVDPSDNSFWTFQEWGTTNNAQGGTWMNNFGAIDDTVPEISISTPTDGATVSGASVNISANTADNVSVASVQFKLDGVNLGAIDISSPYSITWNTTTISNGTHNLTAEARDTSGNTIISSPVAVTVANTNSNSPQLTITSPTGTTVAGSTKFTATSPTVLKSIELLIDGISKKSCPNKKLCSFTWNVSQAAAGNHELKVVGISSANIQSIITKIVTKGTSSDTTPPTILVISPTSGVSITGTTAISATASDNIGVVGVQFELNGENLGVEDTTAPYSYSWNTTTVTNGIYTLTATARDSAGYTTTSAPVSVTVTNSTYDVIPPTVSITAPSNGANVSGSVTVSANATDNGTISSVQFKAGSTVIGTDTTSPYSISWDTTSGTNGSKVLTAVAIDNASNITTSASVNVTVSNTLVISNVNATNITSSSATITWVTNLSSTSVVDYGQTITYGQTANSTSGTIHSVTITGLSSNTLYHFRVTSVDSSGGSQSSTDSTFTTTVVQVSCPTSGVPVPTDGVTRFYEDSFAGGTIVDGYSPAYNAGGSRTLNIPVPTGSTIRKAFLIAGRNGSLNCNLTVTLNGTPYTFNANNQASATFNSPSYGGASAVHAIDVTSNISPTTSSYTLVVPTQSGPANRYNDFALYVAFNNPSMPTVNAAIFLNGRNFASSITHTLNLTNPLINSYPIALSLMTGLICNSPAAPDPLNGATGDGETVIVGSTTLGIIGGPNPGFGTCGGPLGSFSYINSVLTGLNGNNANQTMAGYDALSNISGIILNGVSSFNTTYNGGGGGNLLWAEFVTNNSNGNPLNISSITATPVNNTSENITWTTDIPASSTVNYGSTTAYGQTETGASGVTSHLVSLTGLTPGALYHYRVTSVDASNTATSNDYTFTAANVDSTPPVITNVQASAITGSSATITWTTNETATTFVDYGTTASYGQEAGLSGYGTSHSITVGGLSRNTLYHYRARSFDLSNNTASSPDFTFTTTNIDDTTPPVISGVTAVPSSYNGNHWASVSWTTDEVSTTEYEFGPTTAYGSGIISVQSNYTTSHSGSLNGLTVGNTYHYRVRSTDTAGNEAISGDFTVTAI